MAVVISKQKLPPWLKRRFCDNEKKHKIEELISFYSLSTVCQSAHCPNISECWSLGHATFMVMGDICTRGCRFCAVKTSSAPPPLDPLEPIRLGNAVEQLDLDYVVITSVDRDDLEDGGASHYAKCIEEVKRRGVVVEALIPDFRGDVEAIKIIADASPHVVSHNVETVKRLTPKVRDRRASYEQSLFVLREIKRLNPNIMTKSGIMVGLGERYEEVVGVMKDLVENNVSMLSIGQYLRPSILHLPVEEFVKEEVFKKYEKEGEKLGLAVCAGPFVRSSYKAMELYKKALRVHGRRGGHRED